MEKLSLFSPERIKQWSADEATIEPSTLHTKSGAPAFHWHVPVDYTTGEAKYLIGWPRINHPITTPGEHDWSGWDYLHFWVYTETSRGALPREPANMTIYNPQRQGAFQHRLTELKKNTWVEIKIPLAEIPHPEDIRFMQFNISEADYHHLDQVDFYLSDLSLVRYAEPTLLDFSAEQSVIFNDTRAIPVTFKLTGVKPGEAMEIRCELRRKQSIVASAKAVVRYGQCRVLLDVSSQHLPADSYQLTATLPNTHTPFSTPIRLVESPWK